MKLLDEYFSLQKEIYDYFGYVEDYVVIPIDDARDYFWRLYGDSVRFAETKELLDDKNKGYYSNSIYTQRFLPKWIYYGKDFTMICVDTRVDGNKFLQIFSNCRECF